MANNILKLFLVGTILSASGWCTSFDDGTVNEIFGPGTSSYFSMTGSMRRNNVILNSVSLKSGVSDETDIYLNIIDGEYYFQLTPNGSPVNGSSLFKIGNSYYSGKGFVHLTLDTKAPTNCSNLFADNHALKTLTFGSKFDTSKVTNMSRMLISCGQLVRISTVPARPCKNLTDGVWDLSGFNLSSVTDISDMVKSVSKVSTVVVSDKFNPREDCKYTNGAGEAVFSYCGDWVDDPNDPWSSYQTLTIKSSSATAGAPVFGTNFKEAIEKLIKDNAYRPNYSDVILDTTDMSYVISPQNDPVEEDTATYFTTADDLTYSNLHTKSHHRLDLTETEGATINLFEHPIDKKILNSRNNVAIIATSPSEDDGIQVELSNDRTKMDIISASLANDPLTTNLKPKSLKISGAFAITGYNKFVNAKDTDVTTDKATIRFVGQNSLFQVPMTFTDSNIVIDGRYGDISFDYPITSIRSTITVLGNLQLKHEIKMLPENDAYEEARGLS